MLATALVYKLLEIERSHYIISKQQSTLKDALVLVSTSKKKHLNFGSQDVSLNLRSWFEIPSKFPFIISIDILKQNFKQAVTCMFLVFHHC